MNTPRDIIFFSLSPMLEPLARFMSRRGHGVYYISLPAPASSGTGRTADVRALELREIGILPLPVEELTELKGAVGYYCDKDRLLDRYADELAPQPLRAAFGKLYENNSDISEKLSIFVKLAITRHYVGLSSVIQWALSHRDRSHTLVLGNAFGFLVYGLPSNISLLILPVEAIHHGLMSIGGVMARAWKSILARVRSHKLEDSASSPIAERSRADLYTGRVAFVPHQGLSYGNLYDKRLYYSARPDSELHPESIIHLDYSGYKSPSDRLKWISLRQRTPQLLKFTWALGAIAASVPKIRRLKHLVGVALLTKCYLDYRLFSKSLEPFNDLALALIDYEILCPKGLLLALESRGIRTLAAQERFILPFYSTAGSYLDTYFCGSDFIVDVLKSDAPCYSVKKYLAVGQHRVDELFSAKQLPPPPILRKPIAEGRRIVTVLGFHTHLHWHRSQVDPVLNWTAQLHFLEDMIRLASDLPEIFLILRFKTLDWVYAPVFKEVVERIESNENMAFSREYDQSFHSYHLCAHSQLVIAKHTSLGDECLEIGIPVLFHDYTHNGSGFFADVFDYCGTKVMCFDYMQLLERSRMVLRECNHPIEADYAMLKKTVYGDFGDGKAVSRIQAHIEAALAEPGRPSAQRQHT